MCSAPASPSTTLQCSSPPTERAFGTFRSAESALDVISSLADLLLVWIDESPEHRQ